MNKKLTTMFVLSLGMLGGNDMPYGYDFIKRPKRDVIFEHKEPHQDKGACSKKVRKSAGKRLTRAQRKKLNRR